jgi:hypothetical protein
MDEFPQQEFSKARELYLFEATDLDDYECPDCGAHFHPVNLGQAVDWALGHECLEGSDA